MNDPHVESLEYTIRTGPGFKYAEDAAGVAWETDLFAAELEGGKLLCRLKDHFETGEEATRAVEPYLTRWKIWTGLHANATNQLSFKYSLANVVDRAPSPQRGTVVAAGTARLSLIGIKGTVELTSHNYPEPPPDSFLHNEHVEVLWTLYSLHLEGRSLLLPMAYTCLTYLEYWAGPPPKRRKKAAIMLNVQKAILDKLGTYTSIRGDVRTARKFDERWTGKPLSSDETRWVNRTLTMLIRRLANPKRGEQPQITLDDLGS